MRKAMQLWPVRIGALALVGVVLYGAAYALLPRTVDHVSVTVLQCKTVQPVQNSAFDCQLTTIFRRTFTDAATLSAVHATLDGLPEEVGIFANLNCNAGSLCDPTQVYTFDLLWHGRVVRSYVTSARNGTPINYYFAVRTLGVELWATGARRPGRTWSS